MEYKSLGNCGIRVSRLGFGTLTMSPLQSNLDIRQIDRVNRAAIDCGINFFDAAEQYNNYHILKNAISIKNDIVISAKSYAYTKEMAKESFEKALREIGRDYIDIFSLHEMSGLDSIKGHMEALEYYLMQKEKGRIGAIGISTHHISGVSSIRNIPYIDVVHPIFNKAGMGIVDGKLEDMEREMQLTHDFGKGIFSMKALAGGNLIKDNKAAIDFVMQKPYIDSIVIGMQSEQEVLANTMIFENKDCDKDMSILSNNDRHIHIDEDCRRCYKCIKKCHQNAMSVDASGKVVIDRKKCVLCNYCGSVCEHFCIKVL